MQYLDSNLEFLKERIKEIKIALFRSECFSELQLPNNIISTLQMDNDGNIWFFTSCTGDYAEHVEKSFYASLDYYKKGTDCRIRVSGRAIVVEDEGESFLTMSNYSKGTKGRLILVKMKIAQAEYFESKNAANLNWREKIKDVFTHFFFAETHRIYDFN